MYFTKGDAPAAPLVVLPARQGEVVDLELYTAAKAQLVQPDGVVVDAAARILEETDPDGPAVEITLPTLDQAGLVTVSVQLGGEAGQDTFTLEPLVVEEPDGWHTLATARGEWEGAEAIKDPRLYTLLASAKAACIAFKPAAGARRPLVTEREAQLLQARNRNAAARLDPASGDDGVDGYGATVFPLDWAVKALLRPARRLGGIR